MAGFARMDITLGMDIDLSKYAPGVAELIVSEGLARLDQLCQGV